jgi:hypothetical protein
MDDERRWMDDFPGMGLQLLFCLMGEQIYEVLLSKMKA